MTVTPQVSGRIVAGAGRARTTPSQPATSFSCIDPEPYTIALASADAALGIGAASGRAAPRRLPAGDRRRSGRERRSSPSSRRHSTASTASSPRASPRRRLSTTPRTTSTPPSRRWRRRRSAPSSALAALGGDASIKTDDHPMVLAALAKRDQAALDLANTTVTAPAAGVVAQADRLVVGQQVTPAIAGDEPCRDRRRAGSRPTSRKPTSPTCGLASAATVTVDAYPGQTLRRRGGQHRRRHRRGVLAAARRRTPPATGSRSCSACRSASASTAADRTLPLRTGLSASVSVDTESGAGTAARSGKVSDTPRWPRQQLSRPAVEVKHRGLITVSVMAAMIMVILDMTIANVALPHMQASLGAAQDTITWVLTSYIVAQAIATPITGWLADNIGRKHLFLDLRRRLRRLIGALRHRLRPRGDGALPRDAGRLRRRARAAVPVGHHRHQPARAPGPGDGDVGRRHHGRADHRPDHRRLSHRPPQLALGLLHQHAGRHRSRSSASTCSCRTPSAASAGSISSASPCCRSPSARSNSCSTAARELDWFQSTEILIEFGIAVGRGVDVHRPHRRPARRPFLETAPVHATATSPPSLVFIFIIGIDSARHHGAAAADAAEPVRLPGHHRRAGAGAARPRHDGLDDGRRPAGAARSTRVCWFSSACR